MTMVNILLSSLLLSALLIPSTAHSMKRKLEGADDPSQKRQRVEQAVVHLKVEAKREIVLFELTWEEAMHY